MEPLITTIAIIMLSLGILGNVDDEDWELIFIEYNPFIYKEK